MGQILGSGLGRGGHLLEAGCVAALDTLPATTEVCAEKTVDPGAVDRHLGG